jgi:hypothetical protein
MFCRTTFQNITILDGVGPAAFDFRQAAAVGIIDVVLIDIDSSLKPVGSPAFGISSIVSSSSDMTAFVDVATNCHDFSQLGYYYCRNKCFRTVTYATSPSGTDKFVLRVTDASNPSRSHDYPGYYNFETVVTDGQTPEKRNSWIIKYRYFAPSLPQGRYTAQFIDTRNGQVSWPTFVSTTIEPELCTNSPNVNPIALTIPLVGESNCFELVRNGRMELSTSSYPFWLHAEIGIELVPGGGIGGTSAISDTDNAVNNGYLGQFIDTRCLLPGRQYEISAWVKLVNPTSKALIVCNRQDSSCPSVVLRYRSPLDPTGQSFKEEVMTVAYLVVDTKDGWSLLQNTLTIDSRLAEASSVAIAVARRRGNVKMYVDDVSMSLVRR